jgi:hypothetical protein
MLVRSSVVSFLTCVLRALLLAVAMLLAMTVLTIFVQTD